MLISETDQGIFEVDFEKTIQKYQEKIQKRTLRVLHKAECENLISTNEEFRNKLGKLFRKLSKFIQLSTTRASFRNKLKSRLKSAKSLKF